MKARMNGSSKNRLSRYTSVGSRTAGMRMPAFNSISRVTYGASRLRCHSQSGVFWIRRSRAGSQNGMMMLGAFKMILSMANL